MRTRGFEGATVLITGASSGIGRAFAHKLAARGANLVLTGRSEDALATLARTLREKYPIKARSFVADLSDPASPAALYRRIKASGAAVDLLINNAGFGKWAHFLCEDLPTYQRMLALNIGALVELTYLFVRDMQARGRGGVINVASTAAFQPVPFVAVYAASKSFVLSFTEALAGEYRERGIRFLALCPGNTETNFMAVANANTDGMSFARPEDVAEAGLDAYLRGRSCCVPGKQNYLLSLLPRFLSRQTAVRIVAGLFEKRVAPCPA